MSGKVLGTLLVILSAVLFGLNPLISLNIYDMGFNPAMLTLCAKVLGTLLLLPICVFIQKDDLRINPEQRRKIMLLAVGNTIAPLLLFSSYNYLPSGMATSIHFAYPVLVLLGCVIFYHEKLTRRKALSCVFCVAGMALLCDFSADVDPFGVLIAFVSGIAWAFYIVYLDHSGLTEIPAFKLNMWTSLFAAIWTLPFVLIMKQMVFNVPAVAWGIVVLFAFVSVVLASTAFQNGTKYIGAQKASMLSTFEPLTSVVIGVLVFHEAMNARTAAGVVCILISVIIVSMSDK